MHWIKNNETLLVYRIRVAIPNLPVIRHPIAPLRTAGGFLGLRHED